MVDRKKEMFTYNDPLFGLGQGYITEQNSGRPLHYTTEGVRKWDNWKSFIIYATYYTLKGRG